MAMTVADIVEMVYLCNVDTLMAWAFRKAVGCPHAPSHGVWREGNRGGRYEGVAECFENRKRVLL